MVDGIFLFVGTCSKSARTLTNVTLSNFLITHAKSGNAVRL